MTAVVIIEAVVIVILLVLVAGLLNSHADILRKLDSLGAGDDPEQTQSQRPRTTGLGQAPAGEISGVGPDGSAVTVSVQHGRGETLLAFLSTGCASCRVFWDELSGHPDLPTPNTRTLVVTKGPGSESPGKIEELASGSLSVVMSDDAWDAFKVPITPFFMLVDGHGNVIGEGSATSMRNLLGLFRQSDRDAKPVRLSTRGREQMTDTELRKSGIEPGDQSLYQDPLP